MWRLSWLTRSINLKPIVLDSIFERVENELNRWSRENYYMDKIKNILQLFLSLRNNIFFIALIKKDIDRKEYKSVQKRFTLFSKVKPRKKKSSKILTVKTDWNSSTERERERLDGYTSAEVKSYRPVRATCFEATFEAGNLKSPRGGRKSRSGVRQSVIIYRPENKYVSRRNLSLSVSSVQLPRNQSSRGNSRRVRIKFNFLGKIPQPVVMENLPDAVEIIDIYLVAVFVATSSSNQRLLIQQRLAFVSSSFHLDHLTSKDLKNLRDSKRRNIKRRRRNGLTIYRWGRFVWRIVRRHH